MVVFWAPLSSRAGVAWLMPSLLVKGLLVLVAA